MEPSPSHDPSQEEGSEKPAESPTTSQPASKKSPWRFAAVGSEFMGFVGVGCLIGWYVDGRAGTSPWGLLGGGILGLVAGMYRFLREVLPRDGK